eukprot:3567348-Pleurochrysis_carterae.AAC.3
MRPVVESGAAVARALIRVGALVRMLVRCGAVDKGVAVVAAEKGCKGQIADGLQRERLSGGVAYAEGAVRAIGEGRAGQHVEGEVAAE